MIVDDAHPGTPESTWRASGRIDALPTLSLRRWSRVVVVAPHPDDEVLGAGGLLQVLAGGGTAIRVVAVTDGEASHPGATEAAQLNLADRRAGERAQALARLLPRAPTLTRLGLPDGQVSQHVEALSGHLGADLRPGDLCVAPWWRDGHPDHDAIGAVARRAAATVGCQFLGFLVWAWHWATPEGPDIPWEDCLRLPLARRQAARKRWATGAFATQIRPLGSAPGDCAVLPPAMLRRSWRRSEVFVSDQVFVGDNQLGR